MLEELKREVCIANQALLHHGLVVLTWGNVSAFDSQSGCVVIKPSGVAYNQLTPEKMVVVDLEGNKVEGEFSPSSDTDTHLELYRNFPCIGSVVHTHSRWATIWAQMGRAIPPMGTTHADYFWDDIPCTRAMTEAEIAQFYERNTGRVIVETLRTRRLEGTFAVLVRNHGPFAWSDTPAHVVEKAVALEEVAMMAWHSCFYGGIEQPVIPTMLMKKHFDRKHGKNAYYGQKRKE